MTTAAAVRGGRRAGVPGPCSFSEGTIKVHGGHILAKLGLRDRVQAVVLAYESGVVVPGAH